jgi:hypothetical protein
MVILFCCNGKHCKQLEQTIYWQTYSFPRRH